MEIDVAPQVGELLSDEQLDSVRSQAESGRARCLNCATPVARQAALVLVVDSDRRRVAARLAHPGCCASRVIEAELGDPPEARLAYRWATFSLPGVALLVLESRGGVWTDEQRPAILRMLERLGFESARIALDSRLFLTGEQDVPRAPELILRPLGEDLAVELAGGEQLDLLPSAAAGAWWAQAQEAAGALVVAGDALGLPTQGAIAFEALVDQLLARGVGAWVALAG